MTAADEEQADVPPATGRQIRGDIEERSQGVKLTEEQERIFRLMYPAPVGEPCPECGALTDVHVWACSRRPTTSDPVRITPEERYEYTNRDVDDEIVRLARNCELAAVDHAFQLDGYRSDLTNEQSEAILLRVRATFESKVQELRRKVAELKDEVDQLDAEIRGDSL